MAPPRRTGGRSGSVGVVRLCVRVRVIMIPDAIKDVALGALGGHLLVAGVFVINRGCNVVGIVSPLYTNANRSDGSIAYTLWWQRISFRGHVVGVYVPLLVAVGTDVVKVELIFPCFVVVKVNITAPDKVFNSRVRAWGSVNVKTF